MRLVGRPTGGSEGGVGDFYLAERRKAARRTVERVRERINERAKQKNIAPVAADQFLVTLRGANFAFREIGTPGCI